MNGDRTAEQWAESANEAAQLAVSKATEIANAALRMEQTAGRMERGQEDLRRDVRNLQSRVAVALANLKEQTPRQAQVQHTSITEEDWEDSPTGTRKMVSKSTFEKWKRESEMSDDAKKWRKALSTGGKVALLIVMAVVGAVIRHMWK